MIETLCNELSLLIYEFLTVLDFYKFSICFKKKEIIYKPLHNMPLQRVHGFCVSRCYRTPIEILSIILDIQISTYIFNVCKSYSIIFFYNV